MCAVDEPSENPGWLLDELAWAGRENVDAGHVSRYDRKEDAAAPDEVALCRRLGLDLRSVVIDLGAGTGQFALAAAPYCARVVAVDVSPVMLTALRTKAGLAKVRNLEVVQAGLLTYQHQGPPADLVYSRYALHHLPDFWKAVALARIRRMLRPGALFRLWDAVYSFDPAESEEYIEAWCSTARAGSTDDWNRADIEEHVRDEHSTFNWLLEPMIERCRFTIEAADYSDYAIFAKYVLRAL